MGTNELIFLNPVFKETIWGGNRLKTEFGLDIPSNHIGEMWGISAHPNGDCEIRDGRFAGKKLSELWHDNRELFGDIGGKEFPLLAKIIDANADLSIQVHPDNKYSFMNENGSLGKNECWYVLDCPDSATLVLGHNATSKEELNYVIKTGRWDKFIREVPIQKNCFIQIDAGTVHAIKAGCLIFEVQQSSDVTYRIYDYDRLEYGKKRELHIEKSLDVIEVPAKLDEQVIQRNTKEQLNEMLLLALTAYYKIWKIKVTDKKSYSHQEKFMMVTITDGTGKIDKVNLKKGDCFILPNDYNKFFLEGDMEVILYTVP